MYQRHVNELLLWEHKFEDQSYQSSLDGCFLDIRNKKFKPQTTWSSDISSRQFILWIFQNAFYQGRGKRENALLFEYFNCCFFLGVSIL